jgi:hypothetical protein
VVAELRWMQERLRALRAPQDVSTAAWRGSGRGTNYCYLVTVEPLETRLVRLKCLLDGHDGTVMALPKPSVAAPSCSSAHRSLLIVQQPVGQR